MSNLPFIFYLITGVLLFGGLGIWAELVKLWILPDVRDLSGLITAVITFFPALIGSTTLQLILASINQGVTDKILISFALLVLCVFSAFAIMLPLLSSFHPNWVLAVGFVCSLASIWVWWITNGLDPTYRSQLADAATGGPVDAAPQGSLEGYQV